jgi:putative transposase
VKKCDKGSSFGKLRREEEEEFMKDWQSLSHVKWDCKYHIVFMIKYSQQTIYEKLRSKIGEIIRDLCRQKGLDLHEGHAKVDHFHICLSIPLKYSMYVQYGWIYQRLGIF